MEEKSNEQKLEEAKKKAKPLDITIRGNRVVYLNIDIMPKNKIGKIIIPDSVIKADLANYHYDTHPKQGIIVGLGPEAAEKGLKLLSHVYIREMSAAFLTHKGQTYGSVYAEDILAVIND